MLPQSDDFFFFFFLWGEVKKTGITGVSQEVKKVALWQTPLGT